MFFQAKLLKWALERAAAQQNNQQQANHSPYGAVQATLSSSPQNNNPQQGPYSPQVAPQARPRKNSNFKKGCGCLTAIVGTVVIGGLLFGGAELIDGFKYKSEVSDEKAKDAKEKANYEANKAQIDQIVEDSKPAIAAAQEVVKIRQEIVQKAKPLFSKDEWNTYKLYVAPPEVFDSSKISSREGQSYQTLASAQWFFDVQVHTGAWPNKEEVHNQKDFNEFLAATGGYITVPLRTSLDNTIQPGEDKEFNKIKDKQTTLCDPFYDEWARKVDPALAKRHQEAYKKYIQEITKLQNKYQKNKEYYNSNKFSALDQATNKKVAYTDAAFGDVQQLQKIFNTYDEYMGAVNSRDTIDVNGKKMIVDMKTATIMPVIKSGEWNLAKSITAKENAAIKTAQLEAQAQRPFAAVSNAKKPQNGYQRLAAGHMPRNGC